MTTLTNPGTTDLQILALRARGFQFLNPVDDAGTLLAVVGVRAHHNVLDFVRLTSEHDAVAARLPLDTPTCAIWHAAGPAHEVLDQLLALPDRAD